MNANKKTILQIQENRLFYVNYYSLTNPKALAIKLGSGVLLL